MRFDCNIIQDLLPLYLDHVCSDESKKLVENHLQECETCRTLLNNMDIVQITHFEKEDPEKTEIIKKSFKKIHRRWIASLTAVFMLIPLIFIGILGYNEAHNSGIAFSNLDDVYRCYTYLNDIKSGRYDKAVTMVDFSENEYLLVDCVSHMTLEQYKEYMSERFLKKLDEYNKLGISISNIRFDSAYRWDDGVWCICMAFDEIYPDGSKQTIIADMNGETMYVGAYSFPTKNKTERDDYLDTILTLYAEDESSWYKDFEVSFELKEGEKAIIRRDKKSDTNVKGVFNITYGTGASLIDEPYYQDVFETSVPGKYSVTAYDRDGAVRFLSYEEIDLEIIQYSKENNKS